MNSGAAILNYGDEFGANAVEKTMSNNGPNLRENNLPNVVRPYTVSSTPQDEIVIGDRNNEGISIAKGVGLGGSP